MSGSLTQVDQAELTSDATFTDPLQRVSFQPGILLGAEAMDAEQAYHLRRLTRHQRWLIGPGTVFGMRVDVAPQVPTDPTQVQLTVQPGYGIDGLGREVLATEAYAISLRDWLLANNTSSDVASAYVGPSGSNAGTLYLRITVRSSALFASLQPVVAELFDSGLDPVVPARVQDSFQLELLADINKLDATPARPLDTWSPSRTTPTAANLQGLGTAREQAMLTSLQASNPSLASDLTLQAWLLGQPLPLLDDSPGNLDNLVESSRLLLASVHVSLATIGTPPTIAGTTVNNLVRPFVRANALLAAMSLP